jgi:hypothetical protein
MTLCPECRHFLSRGPCWYDQHCGVSPREPGVDFVTGTTGYVGTNDLGRRYITDEPYQYARDINTDGACGLFEARGAATTPR